MKSKTKREDSRTNEIQCRLNDEKDKERRTSRQPKQANATGAATTIPPSSTITESVVATHQPKRRTVVVSGPIKFFEQTKGMYDESDNESTSTEERTKRKLLKRKGRKTRSLDKFLRFRPFRRSRVLIVIDGNLEAVGSISSTSSLSGRSDDSLPDNDDRSLTATPRSRKRVSKDDGMSTKFKFNKIKKEVQESEEIQEAKPGSNVAGDDPLDPTAITSVSEQHSELLDKGSNHKKVVKRPKKQSSSNKISIRAGTIGEVPKDDLDDDQDPMKVTGCDNGDDDDEQESNQENTENSTVPKSKLRKTLDESTLDLLKSFAQDDLVKHRNNQINRYTSHRLIEEEIELFMHRHSRMAEERTQHELVLLADEESGRAVDGASIFIECLQESEEHTLWQDYFRKAVFESTRNYQELNSSDGTSKCLDKRTLDWVKRNVGFYQYGKSTHGPSHFINSTKSAADNKNSDELTTLVDGNSTKTKSNTGRTIATRRYTRDKVQESRKNEINRGLDVLGCAIDGLQNEFNVLEDTSIGSNPRSSLQKALKTLRDKAGNKKIRISILKQTESNKKNEFDPNTKSFAGYEGVNGCNGTAPPPQLFPSLRQLDALWRRQHFPNSIECLSENMQRKETESDFLLRKRIDLGLHFKESGIVHRLPRWDFFIKDRKTKTENNITQSYPTNFQPSEFARAKCCSQLMDCLKGRARLFTKCEFFYSDLDRGWYNENKFAIDAARLGVPLGSRLCKHEWRAIRRRLNTKIRRFSKSFIRSQLAERNKYRNTIRLLQRNVHLSRTTSFPYEAPAPIEVGTMVDAYCKRYRIIQRGQAMSFDYDSAHYMIQFENPQFGFELCPDSEVASLDGQKLLLRGSHDMRRNCDKVDLSTYCSSISTTPDLGSTESLSVESELQRIFGPIETKQMKENRSSNTPTAISHQVVVPPVKSQSIIDQVAENEAFLTLLSTIDRAKRRKRDILSIIEDTNTLVLRHHPNAAQQIPRLSKSARDHLDWLEANLDSTNRVLNTAMNHLRTLYMTTNRTNR